MQKIGQTPFWVFSSPVSLSVASDSGSELPASQIWVPKRELDLYVNKPQAFEDLLAPSSARCCWLPCSSGGSSDSHYSSCHDPTYLLTHLLPSILAQYSHGCTLDFSVISHGSILNLDSCMSRCNILTFQFFLDLIESSRPWTFSLSAKSFLSSSNLDFMVFCGMTYLQMTLTTFAPTS